MERGFVSDRSRIANLSSTATQMTSLNRGTGDRDPATTSDVQNAAPPSMTMKRGYHIRIVLNPANITRPSTSSQLPDSFIPASLFQPLPSHSAKSSLRRNTLSRTPTLRADYRTGPLSIDWIDFDHMGSVIHKSSERGTQAKYPAEKADLLRSGTSRSSGSHLRTSYTEEDWVNQPSRGDCSRLSGWLRQAHG